MKLFAQVVMVCCALLVAVESNRLALAEDKADDKKDKKAQVEISKPQAGDKVDGIEEVTIQTSLAGEPLILVRSNEPGSLWWVQHRPKALNKSHFISTARIGNAETPVGTEFVMISVLIQDLKDFEKCPPGAPLEEIPEELVRSEEVRVTLEPSPGKVSLHDAITEPRSDTSAGRTVMVTGRVATKGWPVVLVRPAEPNSPWWIQIPVQMTDKDHFRAMARIGNERTPDGMKFEITFIITDNPEAFKPGEAIPKIPKDITRSPTITVVYERGARR